MEFRIHPKKRGVIPKSQMSRNIKLNIMAITVEDGMVKLSSNPKVKATVITIEFSKANRINGQVPAGAEGKMIIKNVPDYQNYVVNDVLSYSDSNSNNNAQLKVTRVYGPTKYGVTRTA